MKMGGKRLGMDQDEYAKKIVKETLFLILK
jgi:hypothetical protein